MELLHPHHCSLASEEAEGVACLPGVQILLYLRCLEALGKCASITTAPKRAFKVGR